MRLAVHRDLYFNIDFRIRCQSLCYHPVNARDHRPISLPLCTPLSLWLCERTSGVQRLLDAWGKCLWNSMNEYFLPPPPHHLLMSLKTNVHIGCWPLSRDPVNVRSHRPVHTNLSCTDWTPENLTLLYNGSDCSIEFPQTNIYDLSFDLQRGQAQRRVPLAGRSRR